MIKKLSSKVSLASLKNEKCNRTGAKYILSDFVLLCLGGVHKLRLQEDGGRWSKKSTFLKLLYHRNCKQRGVVGQKRDKSCKRSLWTPPYQQPLTFGRKIIHWKTETLDTFQNLSFRLDIRNFNSSKISLGQTCKRRVYKRCVFEFWNS